MLNMLGEFVDINLMNIKFVGLDLNFMNFIAPGCFCQDELAKQTKNHNQTSGRPGISNNRAMGYSNSE
jgi:hypothetical protein